jgi:hypothetical protein
MRLSRLVTASLFMPLAGLLLSSCGNPMPPTVSGTCKAPANFTAQGCTGRCLASVTVCPATADAAATSQVQFTATANYTAPPYVVPLETADWGACSNNAPTNNVTITSSGLGKCQSGATGNFTVYAFVPTNCNVIGPCGTGCTVRGTATLACSEATPVNTEASAPAPQ